MAEAVNVRQETLLDIDTVSDYVEARSTEYGLAAINTTNWFPFEFTRGTRGDMGSTYTDRYIATSAIYAALCEDDSRDIAIEKKTINKIQATQRREPVPVLGAITPVEREALAKTLAILNQLRITDAAWREANAVWDVYDPKAIPERDADKIGANEIGLLVEVFGPSVLFYGQRLHNKILTVPAPPPGGHILFESISAVVDADIIAGATPADAAVRAQLLAPITLGGPPVPEAVVRARKFVAQQLFKNLGGVSEANYARPAAAGLLVDLAGEDPWNSILSPLAYEHNILRKYRGGAPEDAYNYVVRHFAELAPWRELMQGIAANGGVMPAEEAIAAPWDVHGMTRPFSIITTTKFAERSAKIVGGFRDVLDGDGKKLMNILGGIVGRYRNIANAVENRLRSEETVNSFVFVMKVLKARREAPPIDIKAWDGLKNTLTNSYGEKFTLGETYRMNLALREALDHAKDKRGMIGDASVALLNLAQIIALDKPQLIK